MNKHDFCQQISRHIAQNEPFFFLVDFETEHPLVVPLSSCHEKGISFRIGEYSNMHKNSNNTPKIQLESFPVKENEYAKAFEIVKNSIHHGNSFLTNLTFPTPIKSNVGLKEIHQQSIAPYKLMVEDKFVVFSPESFIQIRDNKISTFPMKGTILANIENAEQELLNNKKEQWEHNTIVDLMRNDLSMVATKVEVKRFRYITEIATQRGKLLQTSSEIEGELEKGWKNNFGELLLKMLPAGSICGAPKKQTVATIKQAEIDSRGHYTGVFGIYDNGNVDSAVAIRYIEQTDTKELQFRSGGGITFMSKVEEEYKELIEKVYIPLQD